MMRINKNSKGFTLIELLIVVAIIGILAAIAIPAYSGYTTKSKMSGVVHAMGAIKNAICAYYTEAAAIKTVANAAQTDFQTYYAISVPNKYAVYAVSDTGVITATIGTAAGAASSLSSDTDTFNIVLTPDWTTNVWTWSGSVPTQYIPKS